MASTRRRPAVALAAAMLLTGLPSAWAAAEVPQTLPVFFEVQASETISGSPCTGAMLLTEPPGWRFGDAAAVVVADHGRADAARDRLTGAMLAEGAAVLHLEPVGLCGGEVGPMPSLFTALQSLRRDTGAGLVVAIGHGVGGEVALGAASEAEAARYLGRAASERYAAAASFGSGRAAFAPGSTPGAEQAWPMRAGLLCDVLADASAPEGAAKSQRRALAQECHAALVPVAKDGPNGAMIASAPRR